MAARKRPEPRGFKRAKTRNGQAIQDLAVSRKWNPARYKDYLIILGTVIMDWKDRYRIEVTGASTDALKVPMRPILLHKNRAHEVLPIEIADRVWHRHAGCRVQKAGPR